MEASIMVGGNQSVSTVTQDHPQVAGRPFHIRPEGTQARARHELTGNALVRDRVLAQAVLALNAATEYWYSNSAMHEKKFLQISVVSLMLLGLWIWVSEIQQFLSFTVHSSEFEKYGKPEEWVTKNLPYKKYFWRTHELHERAKPNLVPQ